MLEWNSTAPQDYWRDTRSTYRAAAHPTRFVIQPVSYKEGFAAAKWQLEVEFAYLGYQLTDSKYFTTLDEAREAAEDFALHAPMVEGSTDDDFASALALVKGGTA